MAHSGVPTSDPCPHRPTLPKPAALHPERCGLPSAEAMGMVGQPAMEVEAWEALAAYARQGGARL